MKADLKPSASLERCVFGNDLAEAHLDALASRQQDDGGWPIFWTPPSPVSEFE